jgi:antitoxin component YwqK of YwqJK toxin-antitoxin module
LDGDFVFNHGSTTIIAHYKDGKKHGKCETLIKHVNSLSEDYVNGVLHGTVNEYRPHNTPKRITFVDNGVKRHSIIYKHGEPIDIYYKNGVECLSMYNKQSRSENTRNKFVSIANDSLSIN